MILLDKVPIQSFVAKVEQPKTQKKIYKLVVIEVKLYNYTYIFILNTYFKNCLLSE